MKFRNVRKIAMLVVFLLAWAVFSNQLVAEEWVAEDSEYTNDYEVLQENVDTVGQDAEDTYLIYDPILDQFMEYAPDSGRTCYNTDITKTAMVFRGKPNVNYGSDAFLTVGWEYDSSSGTRDLAHAYVGFPACPAEGLLQTATLHYYHSSLYLFGYSGDFHRAKFRLSEGAWSEGTITWNNRPATSDEVEVFDGWYTYDEDMEWDSVALLPLMLGICDYEDPNYGFVISPDNLYDPEEVTILTEDYEPETAPYMRMCYCEDCRIDGSCFLVDELNPNNDCQACVYPTRTSWTNLNGDSCDDGLFCTIDDYCDHGTCTSDTPRWCSQDGLWCNGDEVCDEENDECGHQNAPVCSDDGLWCNGEEFCDEDNDECGHQNVPDCSDDGLWCNGEEYCDEETDQCARRNVPDCPDDGTWCNGEEFCDEDNDQCGHENVPDCSDEGLWCNGEELCEDDNDQCDLQNEPDC